MRSVHTFVNTYGGPGGRPPPARRLAFYGDRQKAPVKAGKVPEFLTIDWVLGQFAEQRTTARQRYRKFVAEGLTDRDGPWRKLSGQVFLGSENFVARQLTSPKAIR